MTCALTFNVEQTQEIKCIVSLWSVLSVTIRRWNSFRKVNHGHIIYHLSCFPVSYSLHYTLMGNILLPLLGWGALGADECNNDDHNHSDCAHGHHYDDQEVTVLLRRGTAMRWTHLANGRLWNTIKKWSLDNVKTKRSKYCLMCSLIPETAGFLFSWWVSFVDISVHNNITANWISNFQWNNRHCQFLVSFSSHHNPPYISS